MPRRRRLVHLARALALVAALQFVPAPGRAQEAGVPFRTGFTVKPSPELAARVPERFRTAGTLTVATDPNTPPTVFVTDDNRTLAGREIDIMSAVAHRLGLEPRWVNAGSFGNIVPGLASGRYDAALANLSVTADRLKQVDFVSYYNSDRLALVRATAGAAAPPTGTDILVLCGETVGAGSGTMNAEALRREAEPCRQAGKAPVDIKLFPGRPAGVQAVLSGRVPGFFGPFEGLRNTVAGSNGTLYLAGVYELAPDYIGIGLAKDSPLTPLVAAAVDSLIADGTYAAILKQWDISFGAVPQAKQNAAILDGTGAASTPPGK